MNIPEDICDSFCFVAISLVPRKAKDDSRSMFAEIEFSMTDYRSTVFGFARYLKGEDQCEAVIPQHLTSPKKSLEKVAYDIRKAPGSEARTQIRLDDSTRSLSLWVRQTKDVPFQPIDLDSVLDASPPVAATSNPAR